MYRWAKTFPFLPFAPVVTQWFYRTACFRKTRLRISVSKEECFCVARRRVSLHVSTCNTEVFSYLICIHSHNEWTCLSCFQVRRVQMRLLFAISSDTCMLLPPVQTLESSHRLCPGWGFFSCLLPLLCRSVYFLRNHFRWIFQQCFFFLSGYFNNTKPCHPKISFSLSRTH